MDEMAQDEQAQARSLGGRVVGFVRRRPLTSLGIVGVIGALGGAEWAAGALLGGALTALVTRDSGRELRQHLAARARGWLHRAEREEPTPPQAAT